jgi:hypothetical protein
VGRKSYEKRRVWGPMASEVENAKFSVSVVQFHWKVTAKLHESLFIAHLCITRCCVQKRQHVMLFKHRCSGTEANLCPELLVLLQTDVYLKFPAPDAATVRGDSKNRKKSRSN